MAELNKSNKKTINVNTYRFASGQTIDEILKSQTSWATDEQCLLNMIDSDWRAVEDFITDKEKELSKKFLLASNNPEVDLKLLAVQSEVATQYLCQKHTNQELWEKARNDKKGMTRPYSKDVVNIQNQINFPYELPSWMKEHIEEIPSNWFQKTPEQLQKEQEKEDIQTTVALNNFAKNIVIEPYSRKPEDIEAMKTFVANVSGINAENITNEQSQAFIDNLGITEEAYLTAKADGTFEYTNNNPYSPDIYKTSEPKEILSIIEDYANDHITGVAPDSEQMKDYEFIHSINEKVNVIENSKNENEILSDDTNNLLKTFDELDKYKGLDNLTVLSRDEYDSYVDDILSKKYKTSPQVIRLPSFNNTFLEKMKMYPSNNYLTAKHLSHFRPERKSRFNQELSNDEIKELYPMIQNAKGCFVDLEKQNFFLCKHNDTDNTKVNCFIFNKDEKGNYIVTAKKMDVSELNKKNYRQVGEGFAPSISQSIQTVPFTEFPVSPTSPKSSIPQLEEKSNKENDEVISLTNQLEKANNTIKQQEKQLKEQDELLNGKGSVKVNGVERTFEHGLKHAFPEAVKRIDIENQRNKDLTAAYNELSKIQIQRYFPNITFK